MPAIAQRESVVRFPARRPARARRDADALAALLQALEVTVIPTSERRRPNTTTARGALMRLLQQQGAQHLTMVIRTIVESDGNAMALIDPVMGAISAVMLAYPAWPATGLRWLEVFDDIDLMRLHAIVRPLKPADHARSTIAGMLVQRLHPIFCPPKVKKQKPVPTAKRSSALLAIDKGLELLARKGPHKNSRIPRDLCAELGVDPATAGYYINAARRYGDRPHLFARLSRIGLFKLARPSLPSAARQEFERRLAAGEKLTAHEIRAARAV